MWFDSFIDGKSVVSGLIVALIAWIASILVRRIGRRKGKPIQYDLSEDVTDVLPFLPLARKLTSKGASSPLQITFLGKKVTKKIYRVVVKFTNQGPDNIETKFFKDSPIKIRFEDRTKVEIIGVFPSITDFAVVTPMGNNCVSIVPNTVWESEKSIEFEVYFDGDHSPYPTIEGQFVRRPFAYSFATKYFLRLVASVFGFIGIANLLNWALKGIQSPALSSNELRFSVYLNIFMFVVILFMLFSLWVRKNQTNLKVEKQHGADSEQSGDENSSSL